MRLICLLLLCLLPGLSFAQDGPIRMLDPVPYARDHDVPDRITRECTDLGHEIAFIVNGLMRGKMTLVKSKLPTGSPGQVLQLEIADVTSDGNAFLGHSQSMTLRGTLYRDGKRVAGFIARRNNQADTLLTACANLDTLVPLLGKDIRRWLKNPVDKAELGRSLF